jgi:hypothetical protein
MTSRFIDFDATRAERENESITLQAFGETFDLPGAMPASVLLDIVRMTDARGDDADMTVSESVELLRRMVPPTVLDPLLDRDDFTTEDLFDLVKLVVGAYAGESGETPAPNREQRRQAPRRRGSPGQSKPAVPKAKASPGRKSLSTGQ